MQIIDHQAATHLTPTNYELWRLDEPQRLLTRSYLDAKITRMGRVSDVISKQPPLLFIHGVEYATPLEVLRDLVQPFLTSIGAKSSHSKAFCRPIYFVSWNSTLISYEMRAQMKQKNAIQRTISIAREVSRWHSYFQDAERRATLAGRELIPYVIEWSSRTSVGPTVISHSLGARVWAEALKGIAQNSSMIARPGIWWNLQPALTRGAFANGGEYEVVAQIYQQNTHAKAVTWYSRFDFVLSTLFWVAKGTPALGQFGCPQSSIPQIDVTKWVGEAHGTNYMSSKLGNFFQRASGKIAEQASDLGIVF